VSNWEIKRRFRNFYRAHFSRAKTAIPILLFLFCMALASGQSAAVRTPVVLTVVDENGLAVSGTAVTILEPGRTAVRMQTDYAGHCSYILHQNAPYQIRVEKAGFYQSTENEVDASVNTVRLVLTHEQIVTEQVNVTASVPGIDTEQPSDTTIMNTPEIVNVPYPTSRDIRNLLPFNPGVVQDATGQVHVAGSPTYETLDTMDGFDIRSPLSGTLALRVSADAVRSTIAQSTRYPVEFGRAAGGVVAFYTGMGDNKFRFNATDFIPSFRDLNGIRFDKFVPRFTFSGPLVRSRAWFYDGLETEWDNIYISELPANADTDELVRGSNLVKVQANLTPTNILNGAVLFNDYHSPYDGISSLNPQQSTTKRDTIAWLPYLRDQWSFGHGALLEVGAGTTRIRDGYEPHGNAAYEITPELPSGSYFENLTGRSQRTEGTATLYLPPRHWLGRHDLKAGIDVDHISFNENVTRASVSYLREDGTLSRQSTFPQIAPFALYNDELGAYAEDHWQARSGLLIETGLRLDWDEIIRRPLFAPRIAAVYAPPASHGATKISAGVGLYYEHTQLEYLTRALAGIRYDTYYEPDGVTPISAPEETFFTADYASLHEARTVNWSVGVEQKLPGAILGGFNFVQKRQSNGLIYANESAPLLSGDYALSNTRQDHYDSVEVNARRTFTNGHTLFASYTRSSAKTNAALDYMPDPSTLGPQQSGPQAWDSPNRVISWGWLPLMLPRLSKRWDFVYTVDWHTGFPYTSVDQNQQVVGAAGSQRFPDYVSLSPGLEWRFHFRGAYFGLRGIMENATNSKDPLEVNNVVVSPQYGTVSEFLGRAFTARIRLIGAK